MEENKDVTLHNLAEKLKLASSTISKALKNCHLTISAKTIKKVKKIACKMNYTQNILSAGLRGNKTKTIDVLIPTLTHSATKMSQIAAEIILKSIRFPNKNEIKETTFLNT